MDLDAALKRIHAHDSQAPNGFGNHAPMVVEALVSLDRADYVEPFLDDYLHRFPDAPVGSPIEDADREKALGLVERRGDWVATWRQTLEQASDWSEVLANTLPDLAPAMFSAAAHGLLRVAHATRSLERGDTPERRNELAEGLGYWFANHQTLPGDPGSHAKAGATPKRLIEDLVVVPPENRSWGLFTEGVCALSTQPEFARQIEALQVPEEINGEDVSDVCQAMLEPYFESPMLRIAYVHTVTAPSSLRLIAAHLDQAALRDFYRYGVQAVAALHAISKLPTASDPNPDVEALAGDDEALRTRAAATLEEHVIKFTDACLRENAERRDPRWLTAAADAIVAREQQAAGAPR